MPAPGAAIYRLDPADVLVEDRIGIYWPEKAAAYGALMKRDGQTDPIKVTWRAKDEKWQLVAGLHRREGAILAGLPFVDAIEVKGKASDLRRMEVSENIHRRDFNPIERSLFVRAMCDEAEARWTAGYDGLSIQAIGQIRRWESDKAHAPGVYRDEVLAASEAVASAAKLGGTYGWQEDAADALGLSTRSLQRSLTLHRQIVAPFPREIWEGLARTPHGANQSALEAIGKVAAVATRRKVIEAIVANPALSVDQAMLVADAASKPIKPRVTGDTKFMNNAQSNLSRLTAAGWRSFVPTIVEMAKPSSLQAMREAIDARLAELGDATEKDAE